MNTIFEKQYWDAFKNSKITVHCTSKKSVTSFLEFLILKSYRDIDGMNLNAGLIRDFCNLTYDDDLDSGGWYYYINSNNRKVNYNRPSARCEMTIVTL